MSLRTLHVVFVLCALVLTDMFGAWAIHEFASTRETSVLIMGISSFVLGFALVAYGAWMVHKLDRERIT